MKLLFVAKREPQQRDLVTRPYGRFHFLPTELARRGHDVRMFLVSHRDTPPATLERQKVRITAFQPRGTGFRRTLLALEAEARALREGTLEGAAALGLASAIAAFGGFFIPKAYGTAMAMTGGTLAALYPFLVFYLSCIVVTWWFYVRRRPEIAC